MATRQNLISYFETLAVERSNEIAIFSKGKDTTFGELARRVEHHRATLRSVLGKEQAIVGHSTGGGLEPVSLELAVWAEGHVSLALPSNATRRETVEMLDVVVPDLIFVDEEGEKSNWIASPPEHSIIYSLHSQTTRYGQQTRSRVHLPVKDLLQLQFTSGSTGRPKAVGLEANALMAALQDAKVWYSGFQDAPVFSALPHHHAMGRAVPFEAIWSGRAIASTDTKAWADHLELLLRTDSKTLVCNPTYARYGVALGLFRQTPSIDRVVLGTASTEAGLVINLREQLPDVAIDIRYGISEAFGAISVNQVSPKDPAPSTGDVGCPMPSLEIMASSSEPGPTYVRGAATAIVALQGGEVVELRDASGYVETGDLGVIASNGDLKIGGRTKINISHQGYRIDPLEIESVIKAAPSVVDAVVVGVPDKLVGEKIVAVVVMVDNVAIDANGLKHRCKEGLSSYKVPSGVVVLPEMPFKASGKPDRDAIRTQVLDRVTYSGLTEAWGTHGQ